MATDPPLSSNMTMVPGVGSALATEDPRSSPLLTDLWLGSPLAPDPRSKLTAAGAVELPTDPAIVENAGLTGGCVGLAIIGSPYQPGEALIVGLTVFGGARKSTGTREVGGS